MRALRIIRSCLTAVKTPGRTLGGRTVASKAAEEVEVPDGEAQVEVAAEKLKSLAVAEKEQELEHGHELMQNVARHVQDGVLGVEDLMEGLHKGQMTQSDLQRLVDMQALSPFAYRHIQTSLHRGMAKLSILEMMALLRMKRMGMEDLLRIVRQGDLSLADVEFLVSKELVPRDVADVVVKEVQEQEDLKNSQERGFSVIRARLGSGQLRWSGLDALILSGDLHPDDVLLLVSENVLPKHEAEKILDKCAEEVLEVYEEAEKFAELVGNGRFTFEELEVMRAKGVLGASLIHYLVIRNALDDKKGQELLQIEEDLDYFDPEETDDEAETHVPSLNYNVETDKAETASTATASQPEDTSILGSFQSVTLFLLTFFLDMSVQGGASDEGFYPQGINKDDTFSLWEYLQEVYPDRSSAGESLDVTQDEKLIIKRKATIAPIESRRGSLPEAKMDADGTVFAIGRRKSSVAKISLRKGTGNITVNDKRLHDYFINLDGRCYVVSPFLATDTLGQFDADIAVEGGGWSGQAQAIRHGIARALHCFDAESESTLKELGLLTRDARIVERKKPGKAKARKSFQWVKR